MLVTPGYSPHGTYRMHSPPDTYQPHNHHSVLIAFFFLYLTQKPLYTRYFYQQILCNLSIFNPQRFLLFLYIFNNNKKNSPFLFIPLMFFRRNPSFFQNFNFLCRFVKLISHFSSAYNSSNIRQAFH